jgi:MFS family permease
MTALATGMDELATPDPHGSADLTPFGRLFAASAVSNLGDGLRLTALPLLAASLTRDPATIATVSAVLWLPWLLFGAFGGAIVDRVRRVRLLVTVQLFRVLMVGGLALAIWTGRTRRRRRRNGQLAPAIRSAADSAHRIGSRDHRRADVAPPEHRARSMLGRAATMRVFTFGAIPFGAVVGVGWPRRSGCAYHSCSEG